MIVDSPLGRRDTQRPDVDPIPGIYMPILYRALLWIVVAVGVVAISTPIALMVFTLMDFFIGARNFDAQSGTLATVGSFAGFFQSFLAIIGLSMVMIGVKMGAMAGLMLGLAKRSLFWFFCFAIVGGLVVVAAGRFVDEQIQGIDLATLRSSDLLEDSPLRQPLITTFIVLVVVSAIVRYAAALVGHAHRLGMKELTLGLIGGGVLFLISTRFEFFVQDLLNLWPEALTGLGVLLLELAIPGLLLDRMQAGYD